MKKPANKVFRKMEWPYYYKVIPSRSEQKEKRYPVWGVTLFLCSCQWKTAPILHGSQGDGGLIQLYTEDPKSKQSFCKLFRREKYRPALRLIRTVFCLRRKTLQTPLFTFRALWVTGWIWPASPRYLRPCGSPLVWIWAVVCLGAVFHSQARS